MKPLRIIRSAWFVCVVPVIAAGCHIEQWTRSLTIFDADARAVLASMTLLEEKIGQMIRAESSGQETRRIFRPIVSLGIERRG